MLNVDFEHLVHGSLFIKLHGATVVYERDDCAHLHRVPRGRMDKTCAMLAQSLCGMGVHGSNQCRGRFIFSLKTLILTIQASVL